MLELGKIDGSLAFLGRVMGKWLVLSLAVRVAFMLRPLGMLILTPCTVIVLLSQDELSCRQ